jgi:hypothetical protein
MPRLYANLEVELRKGADEEWDPDEGQAGELGVNHVLEERLHLKRAEKSLKRI